MAQIAATAYKFRALYKTATATDEVPMATKTKVPITSPKKERTSYKFASTKSEQNCSISRIVALKATAISSSVPSTFDGSLKF